MSLGTLALGKIGEQELNLICSKAGFLCTNTNRDENGWDALIECPNASPLKYSSISSKCLVQVKSTNVGQTRWEISLKNALSLASNPDATFMALMTYESGENLKKIYFLHFDKKVVKRIYQRLNKEYEKDPFVEIHRKTISFDFKEGKVFDHTYSAEIKSFFETTFVSDNLKYVATKALMVSKLYEEKLLPFRYVDLFLEKDIVLFAQRTDNQNSVEVRVQGREVLKHLFDFTLGYNDTLPKDILNKIAKIANMDSESSIVSSKIKSSKCKIHFQHSKTKDPLVITEVDLFATSVIRGLPSELETYRLRSLYLDILIRKSNTKFMVSFLMPYLDTYLNLEDLHASIQLYESIFNCDKDFSLQVEAQNGNNSKFNLKTLPQKKRALPENLSVLIERALVVFKYLEYKSLTSIHLISQCELPLVLINIFLGHIDEKDETYFDVFVKSPNPIDRGKPVFALITAPLVVSEDHLFYCSFLLPVNNIEVRDDGEYAVCKSIKVSIFRHQMRAGLFKIEDFEVWKELEIQHYEKHAADSTIIIAES